jgi:demethylmenaquinone methyltransferase / 2-methoxy-6-polyprenyl-1,4-benzoquinol methylase
LSGLGKAYWSEIILTLRNIIPIYDRVNRVISLGKDATYRKKCLNNRLGLGERILDAGSGFGNMSRLARGEVHGNIDIVMYDPIIEMLLTARSMDANICNNELSAGIFEYLPFNSDIFDAVLCGYSLRDAIYLKKAILEFVDCRSWQARSHHRRCARRNISKVFLGIPRVHRGRKCRPWVQGIIWDIQALA